VWSLRLSLLLALLVLPVVTTAQPRTPDPAAAPAEVVSSDSPRAAMTRYLAAARQGQWSEAGRYLDLSHAQSPRAEALARALLEVLDRHVWIDPRALSPESQGDIDDGLAPRTDEIARLPGPTGIPEPVTLTRRTYDDGARWVFARATTGRIDAWYAALEGRWLRERLPVWALRRGARDLAVWQWIALPVLTLAAWLIARALASLTNRGLSRALRRLWPDLADALRHRAAGPVTGLWMVPLLHLGVGTLQLYPPAAQGVDAVLRASLFAAVFWGLWGAVGLVSQALLGSAWAATHPSSDTLVPLGSRVVKVVVFALAVTAVLSSLGYPVASLVAGLGVGGIALALAAQKTGEHLFGSFALGLDQPFRVGDFVQVDEHSGTVESLGLRSTRLRTMARTVVTIPNGKLADLRVENFTLRDRYYFNPRVAVAPDTAPDDIAALVEAIRAMVTARPDIADDEVLVFVQAMTAESVVIEVQSWFKAESWSAYLPVRSALFLDTLRAVRERGVRLAAPIRVLRTEA
jgi:MscS family membrane protein